MKKSFILGVAVSIIITLVLPWLTVTFVNGDGGMAVCLLLFFAVNPFFSVVIGAFAGKDIRNLWVLPIIFAVFFVVGAWLFFDMGDPAFIIYASVYLALGAAAMLISGFIRKKIHMA